MLHNFAHAAVAVHDQNEIRKRKRLKVMCDEHPGTIRERTTEYTFFQDVLANLRIHCGEDFIEENHLCG